MRGLLPPTPLGPPPGGEASRRSACPIAWRGRATSRKEKRVNHVSSQSSWEFFYGAEMIQISADPEYS
eukprot:2365465-Pyramimonas_sp.AAC.1